MTHQLSFADVNKIDVLIIGAGPIGLAAAEWFAKEKHPVEDRFLRVVVVEQYLEKASTPRDEYKKAFNERHQQVGLDPTSLLFLHQINTVIWGKVMSQGCSWGNWINIPIYLLQNIFYKELRTMPNITFLFNSRVESVTTLDDKNNARVIIAQDNSIYSFYPELVVVADGRHDDKGTAKHFFGFPSASKVALSSCGIIGMMQRDDNESPYKATLCLKNYSTDDYQTKYGSMHVRLLGSLHERYIALGVADLQQAAILKKLTSNEIHDLLKTAYDELRDPDEPPFNGFTEHSKTPINIVLDYRKETIKVLEGSNTVVSVEGDAARKTTFFSGSGLNSGYRGLAELFRFCQENRELIFGSQELLLIDQKLLEKDRAALSISLELLKKGISFIIEPKKEKEDRGGKSHDAHASCPIETKITSITPTTTFASSYVQIEGYSLVKCGQTPIVMVKWNGGSRKVTDIIASANKISVKIPKDIHGEVSLSLIYHDKDIIDSPIKIAVNNTINVPIIREVIKEETEGSYHVIGDNFAKPTFILVNDRKIKGYCYSTTSLKFHSSIPIAGKVTFIAITNNGQGPNFEKEL